MFRASGRALALAAAAVVSLTAAGQTSFRSATPN